MSCGHTKEEHDYRKRSSQWPKQAFRGIQEGMGHKSLELRNCEDNGTMAKVIPCPCATCAGLPPEDFDQ